MLWCSLTLKIYRGNKSALKRWNRKHFCVILTLILESHVHCSLHPPHLHTSTYISRRPAISMWQKIIQGVLRCFSSPFIYLLGANLCDYVIFFSMPALLLEHIQGEKFAKLTAEYHGTWAKSLYLQWSNWVQNLQKVQKLKNKDCLSWTEEQKS